MGFFKSLSNSPLLSCYVPGHLMAHNTHNVCPDIFAMNVFIMIMLTLSFQMLNDYSTEYHQQSVQLPAQVCEK